MTCNGNTRLVSNAVLRQTAAPVAEVTDETRCLTGNMFRVMKAADGVGLAAPQVGVSQRIAVTHDDEGEELVLINPVIKVKKYPYISKEGCLSLPGKSFRVRRYGFVVVEYTDLDGLSQSMSAQGNLARVLLHEVDHLHGRLIDARR